LAEFQGVLQVDGYSGFKSLLTDRPPDQIKLAFCWAHCRRGFYELYRSTGSPLAEEALRRIGELYRIKAEISGRPAEERRTVRQERSKPIVEALHAWLTIQLGRVSGRSTLAEAIRYALRHWTGLVLFLDDGRVELDTNVQPLLLAGAGEYGMFEHFQRYPWVLGTYVYASPGELIANLGERVMAPPRPRPLSCGG
jgi:transposase